MSSLAERIEGLRQSWDELADDMNGQHSFDFRCGVQRCEAELAAALAAEGPDGTGHKGMMISDSRKQEAHERIMAEKPATPYSLHCAQIRNDALEEAAALCTNQEAYDNDSEDPVMADKIRALKRAAASSLHKEGAPANPCERCGKDDAQEWAVENDLWLRLAGKPNGMLCISCFDALAEQQGIILFWTARISKHSGGAGHKEGAGGKLPELTAEQTALCKCGHSAYSHDCGPVMAFCCVCSCTRFEAASPAGRAEQEGK